MGLVEHFLSMPWFYSSTFEKLYFLKMGPIFAGSYATQNKPIKKTICWHQLFRQKWAFSRLSTYVLHKCGHTKGHLKQSESIEMAMTHKNMQFEFHLGSRLVWPQLWSTVVLSLENAHFCLKSWCQQIFFSLDLFLLAHDTTKIGPFFRK